MSIPVGTIEDFLAAVDRALGDLPRSVRAEALDELESLLCADAERSSEEAAVAALGSSEAYAAEIRAALQSEQADDHTAPQGRILGMPYDFRGASVERVGARMWNTGDPRIFTPRLFGLGWTINFGALAVRLGLIRPDDLGDESFERIPAAAVAIVFAIPVVLATATLALMVLSWSGLPAEVPTHWGVSGQPDGFSPKGYAFAGLFLLTVLPVIVSAVTLTARRAGKRDRVLSGAGLSLVALLGLAMTAFTVADADGGSSGGWLWLVILGGIALAFLSLYVPSRLGLRAEWRAATSHEEGEEQ